MGFLTLILAMECPWGRKKGGESCGGAANLNYSKVGNNGRGGGNLKIQYWRGVTGLFGWKGAQELEFETTKSIALHGMLKWTGLDRDIAI
jgi:hypothetical protein